MPGAAGVTKIDKIAATKGRVALRYGPLIYSLESVDQKLNGVLRPDAEWLLAVRDSALAAGRYDLDREPFLTAADRAEFME